MSTQHVSRRSVARGAAWSVPVVAIAVAAPAFAASPGSFPRVTLLGGCRCGTGGGSIKTLRLDVTFTNNLGSTFAITNPGVTINAIASTNVALQVTAPPQNNQVPAGSSKVLHYTFQRGSNPASADVTFTYTVTNTSTNDSMTDSVTLPVTFYTCSDTCEG